MLQNNVGNIDRAIRGIVGALLVLAFLMGWVGGTLGVALLIVGVVLAATAALSTCPAYSLLGLKTCKTKA